jgi:hypothetical protein
MQSRRECAGSGIDRSTGNGDSNTAFDFSADNNRTPTDRHTDRFTARRRISRLRGRIAYLRADVQRRGEMLGI